MPSYNQAAGADDARYENCEYKAQMPDLELVRDVYAGSRVIKEAGAKYLPQEPKETDEAWAIRLKRSGWWGGYRKTVRALVGMVFRKAPVLSEGVAQQILNIVDNIDLQGNDLQTFVKNSFRQAFDGHSFILIDMPRPLDPEVATLANESGRRPYWCPRTKDQVINWQESTSDAGEIVLTQVTIHECLKEAAGRFAETEVEQWRVLSLVGGRLEWEIWREREGEEKAKELYLHDGGIVPQIDFIPLVVVPTNSTGFLTSDPPLKDLADLNISHYQLWSDIKNIIHRCCVPILAFFGRSEEDNQVEIGPNAGVDMPIGGDVKYVEPAGTGIASAQEEMKCTERLMGVMGLELLAPRSDVEVTATQSAIDDSSQISEIGGMVESLDNAVNQALYYTSRFFGLTEVGGEWKANKDFNRLKLDSAMLTTLSNLVLSGQWSVDSLWWAMERGELQPPNFDPVKEKMLIGEQQLLTPKKEPVVDPALAA